MCYYNLVVHPGVSHFKLTNDIRNCQISLGKENKNLWKKGSEPESDQPKNSRELELSSDQLKVTFYIPENPTGRVKHSFNKYNIQ